MTLPASGAISMSEITDEFRSGFNSPDSMSELYRGGSFVPNIAANSGVPTSGAIAFSDLYSSTANYLETTMTIGNSGPGLELFGFFEGVEPGSEFGALANANMSNGQTVSAWWYDTSSVGSVTLWLQGDSVPNSDSTFRSLRHPTGLFLFRSAAFYNSSVGGEFSEWFWTPVTSNPLGTSGDVLVRVRA